MKHTKLNDLAPFGGSELHSAEELMYGDKPLTPKMISSLMHVDVSVRSTFAHEGSARRKQGHSFGYIISLTIVSIIIGLVIGVGFLYLYNIGPFYKSYEIAEE
jgi:hypothetical protein